MDELKGSRVIELFRKKWNQQNTVAYVILSFAVALFVSAFVIKWFSANWFIVPAIVAIVLFVVIFLFLKKISQHDVVKFLNEAFPELEESSNLLLKPYESLNMLEKLQVKKVHNKLQENIRQPDVLRRKIKMSSVVFVVALLLTIALFIIPFDIVQNGTKAEAAENISTQTKPETKLPEVEDVEVKITPPSYTGKEQREQNRFNVAAEQGADVLWKITTSTPVKNVDLIFNDKSMVRLQAVNKSNTNWLGRMQVRSSGFYQVKIGDNVSELYQVEMIKDQPPVIIIQSPEPSTVIEYGQPQKVSINLALSDDYGISSVFINATTASGSGEAVKFKEQQISFSNFAIGNRQYQLQKQMDLGALGMQPGDELYFYVNARDNYQQEKRSDVYVVRMEDTAQLMSIDGLVSGVDVKPEFFRSQRQIIIETEQLIKDRDTISIENFNKKSADLGVDQKLLRLRYGKFLGEENETGIGGDHDDHGSEQVGAGAKSNEILDQYSHKHDNAEDATFFDAKTKKQLLATLSEMWKAELQLRTMKPREALPFEYKALRLLKDLQQQTRAYVGKTGTKTTPLKPEIRLTGDLTKITGPVIQQDFQQKADPVATLRKALGILEMVRNREALQRPSIEILEQASMQLSAKATSEPSRYLASLEAVRRILNRSYKPKDIAVAGTAFQRMIGTVSLTPQQTATAPDILSRRYFKNLNLKND